MTTRMSLPSLLNSLKSNVKTEDEIYQMFTEIRRVFKSRDLHERTRAFNVLAACIKHQQDGVAGIRLKILDVLCQHPNDWVLKQEIVRAIIENTRGDADSKHIVGSIEFHRILETWTKGTEDFGHFASIIIRAMKMAFGQIPEPYIRYLVIEKICKDADQAITEKNMYVVKRCMQLADTIVRYGHIENSCIEPFIKTICRTVNVRSADSWRIMQCLLRSERGLIFQYGLLKLLDKPERVVPVKLRPSILRGTVFFVGMSTWGSQKVISLKSPFPAILPSFRNVIRCDDITVISEVLLSFQRLIKKYGSTLRIEWDIIYDILKHVFARFSGQTLDSQNMKDTKSQRKLKSPTLQENEDKKSNSMARISPVIANATSPTPSEKSKTSNMSGIISSYFAHKADAKSAQKQIQGGAKSIEIVDHNKNLNDEEKGTPIKPVTPQFTNSDETKAVALPKRVQDEICKMLIGINKLIQTDSYFGSQASFFSIVEVYQEIMPLHMLKQLLFHKLENAHPSKDNWILHLKDLMKQFFHEHKKFVEIRLEALSAVQESFVLSAHSDDVQITNEIILPYMNNVFNDPSPDIRKRGLSFLIEAARQKYFEGFDTVLKILENCLLNAIYEDSQILAMKGLTSLLSSTFDHVPYQRPLAILDLVCFFLEDSQNVKVRELCLECLKHLRADDKDRCQWVATRVRASNFLLCSGVPPADFIGVLPMSRYFNVLTNRLHDEKNAYLLHSTMKVILTMIENRFIIRTVPLGHLASKLCKLITAIFEGHAKFQINNSANLSKNENWDVSQKAYNRQSSSRGPYDEDESTPSSIVYPNGSGVGGSRPSSRDSNFSPLSSDGSVTSGSGDNVSIAFQESGMSSLYRLLSTPLSSPIMSPETTPVPSPHRTHKSRANAVSPETDMAQVESYNMAVNDMNESNQSASLSMAKVAEVAMHILCILAGCHGSLPFHVEDEIFRCFLSVLERFTIPRRSGDVDIEVYGMISKFTSIVLRGLSLHVLIAPTIAMNYLPDVINTLNHFVLSVAYSEYKKIHFISILNFCRTLLGSSGSTIKTVLVEAHFSTIIDIVLAHLTYTICVQSTSQRPIMATDLGQQNYILALTYQTFALCYTSCPQHLRSKYAPAILKKLNLLKHNRNRRDGVDYDNAGDVLLAQTDDNTFALVDLLHDLVSRYTHMRINYLPLSLRGGSDSSAINFMFPKDSTSEKTFMCSSSLLTVRMGARGMSEITVRGPTGAKQWLIQAQQENISSSTHPLLRLMPATVMKSMLEFRNRAQAFRRRSPYMTSPVSIDGDKMVDFKISSTVSKKPENNNLNKSTIPTRDLTAAVGIPLKTALSSPKAKKKELVSDQTLIDQIGTGSPSSLTLHGSMECQPSPSAFAPILKRPRSSTDTMVEVRGPSSAQKSLSSNMVQAPGEHYSKGDRPIQKNPECNTLLMQMAIGPPKSRLRNRAHSESQIAKPSAQAMKTASIFGEMEEEVIQSSGILSGVNSDKNDGDVIGILRSTKSNLSDNLASASPTFNATDASQVNVDVNGSTPIHDEEKIKGNEDDNLATGRTSETGRESKTGRFSRNSHNGMSIFDDLRISAPNVIDPHFLISQLGIGKDTNLRLIPSDSKTLKRALTVLDRTPCAETHKIGLIYVPPGAIDEGDILVSETASYEFLELMSSLGEYVRLEDCEGQGVYSGGLDCSPMSSDGEYGLAWRNECCQIMFHCTLLMANPNDAKSTGMSPKSPSRTSPILSNVNKKRHVGNDFVHIVFTDNPCVEQYPYDQETMRGQFNCVHIVIRPLDHGFFRVDVKAKPNVPKFGPLDRGCHILTKGSLASIVRETAVQADIACRFLMEMNGGSYISHTMERLKQIKRMEERL